MRKEILMNSTEYEKRAALIEDGRLVELMVERSDNERNVGDIYKGVIQSVLPGMQSAFIDIGWEKAAYLHASDVGKDYGHRYDQDDYEEDDAPPEIVRKSRRQGIEAVLKRNQEVLVQIIKEPISTKGPRVATEVSIPGRFIVMVPDDDHVRVSKRISDWGEKKRLRKLATPLRPEGFGLIIRTEAEGAEESDLKADIRRIQKLWSRLNLKAERTKAPALIHKEAEMTVGMIRDVFTTDTSRLVSDNRDDYKKIMSFIRQVAPELRSRVELYKGAQPLFDAHGLEGEIEQMMDRKVWVRKGAYIIIDQTEAMVTIDVNTGRFVGSRDQESTIFQTNIIAAREIARQIRLRDIGGLIICDFIDMYNRENRRRLYEEFKNAFRNDRAKRAISPVSDFGIVEMTRERVRPSHLHTISDLCPCCSGLGRVTSRETMATKVERWFLRAKADRKYRKFHLMVAPNLAELLVDNGTNRVTGLMDRHKFQINLVRDTTIQPQEFRVFDSDRNEEITDLYKVKTI